MDFHDGASTGYREAISFKTEGQQLLHHGIGPQVLREFVARLLLSRENH